MTQAVVGCSLWRQLYHGQFLAVHVLVELQSHRSIHTLSMTQLLAHNHSCAATALAWCPRHTGMCCAVGAWRGGRLRQDPDHQAVVSGSLQHKPIDGIGVAGCVAGVCADAHKTGVAQEAAKTASKVAKGVSAQEARQILHVDPQASWVDVTKVCVLQCSVMTLPSQSSSFLQAATAACLSRSIPGGHHARPSAVPAAALAA